MSKFANILDALEAKLHSAGIKTVHRGTPSNLPSTPAEYPLVILEVGALAPENKTFGKGGLQQQPYLVIIRMLLGAADTQPAQAQSRFLPWPDKLRAALMGADRTMGGLVFDSAISQPFDNLRLYQRMLIAPEVNWRFLALVLTTPETAAS